MSSSVFEGDSPHVESLDGGLAPLQTWFNENASHVRVLGVVSSTCPMCVRGRREALEPLLSQPGDYRMAWIFIDMMETDSLESAAGVASAVADPRLTVFHDPHKRAGLAVAHCLGWTKHVAWDTYLIYRGDARWTTEGMPSPDVWYHQLKDRDAWKQTAQCEVGTDIWTECLADKSEADPNRFATGNELRNMIEAAVLNAGAVG